MGEIVLPTGSRASRIGVLVLVAALAILSVRTGLGFMLARANPPLAYQIDPGNPDVAAAQATHLVLTSPDASAVGRVEQIARAAVAGGPLSPFAVRNLGFAIQAGGNKAGAVKLIDIAGRISRRDFLTHAWLLEERRRTGKMADAVYQADLLMRQRTSNYSQFLPIMVALLADRRTVAPLTDALLANPVWRPSFVEALGGNDADLENKLGLLTALKQRGSPATNRELVQLFQRAWGKMDPRVLRGHWDRLVTVPAGARSGLLIDGGFEYSDLPPPFTWALYPNQEVYAEIERRPDSGHALFVSFEGTRDVQFAGQQLLLPPGRYRLTGVAKGEDSVSDGQFLWTLRCSASDRTGGEIAATLPLKPELDRWRRFTVMLTVPENCREQQLWLAGAPRDPAGIASLMIDALSLERL